MPRVLALAPVLAFASTLASGAAATPPAAPPAVAPAYDLAADRAQRIAEAERELGKGTRVTVVEDVFLLVGEPASAAIARDALAAYFNGRFDARPAKAVSVYLFASAKPYEAYCRAHFKEACISPFGFYRYDERRIVMNAGPGLGTLTHELVHPIVEADFPRAPTWINEGIASLFEAPVIPRKGEIHGAKNWRLPRLIAALDTPKEQPQARLERLFGMTDETFRDDDLERLHYAMARYVCQWLDGRGLLWPFYREWRDHADGDPTGEKAFVKVVGIRPAEAHAAWVRWVRAL